MQTSECLIIWSDEYTYDSCHAYKMVNIVGFTQQNMESDEWNVSVWKSYML